MQVKYLLIVKGSFISNIRYTFIWHMGEILHSGHSCDKAVCTYCGQTGDMRG